MVWDAIGYNMLSCLLLTQSNPNRNRYIREVLEPKVLPLLQTTLHSVFQQDNAQPYVARIVQTFFEERWVSLPAWPAHLPYMLPIEYNVSRICLVDNLLVMVFQQPLLMYTRKLPQQLSRPSLTACHNA